MSTPSLTDFLLARIAEDEAAAIAAHRESMRGRAGPGFARSLVAWQDQAKDVRGRDLIGRMTPARVLAECEAKRRIVEEHYFMPRHESRDFGFEDGNCVTCRKQGPCTTLRLLALPYVDHPDYCEEWKP